MVGIEQQLLQRSRVPQDLLRYIRQRTVPLIHVLDLPIAALEYRDAFKHCRSGDPPSTALWFFLQYSSASSSSSRKQQNQSSRSFVFTSFLRDPTSVIRLLSVSSSSDVVVFSKNYSSHFCFFVYVHIILHHTTFFGAAPPSSATDFCKPEGKHSRKSIRIAFPLSRHTHFSFFDYM